MSGSLLSHECLFESQVRVTRLPLHQIQHVSRHCPVRLSCALLFFRTKFKIYVVHLWRSVWKSKQQDLPKRGDVTGWICSRTAPAWMISPRLWKAYAGV